jgi:hypothetical protein
MPRSTAAMPIALAVSLSACTTMRVTGMVTDEQTGEPVGVCGITSGTKYVRTDPIGRYAIPVKREWKTMQVVAPGYERKTVTFGDQPTRRPVIDVGLTPKSRSESGRVVSPAAPSPKR